MKQLYIFIFILFVHNFQGFAQKTLSEKATVSVVTCGPGSEMYSTFGHSAFRIYDPVIGLDKIYNYGTFDFNAPHFYLNFAKGKLTYQLSTTYFGNFMREYEYENRWVKLQVLDLDAADVQSMFDFLENNAKPENRAYQYDFFYDNCSTKIEEVLKTVLKDKVTFSNSHIKTSKTHRDLIADYTVNQKWGKFGIDLALGSVIDKKATKDDYKFLPDYIFEAFENATITSQNGIKPLVKVSGEVLNEKKQETTFEVFQPLIVFSLLLLLISYVTYKNHKEKKRTKWIDFLLFFITGLIGIAVLLLWFATSHTATYKNFNFLWAFAPNLVVSFYMLKSKLPKWVFSYIKLLLILLAILLLLWSFKIQVFNIAMIPIIIMLIVRFRFLLTQKVH